MEKHYKCPCGKEIPVKDGETLEDVKTLEDISCMAVGCINCEYFAGTIHFNQQIAHAMNMWELLKETIVPVPGEIIYHTIGLPPS